MTTKILKKSLITGLILILTTFVILAIGFSSKKKAYAADSDWYTGYSGHGVYEIGTAGELAHLATIVNDGTDSFNGKTIMLTADIDLSAYGAGFNGGKGWIPIGKYSLNTPFMGTFDGNGCKITGLYINDTSDNNVSLFGYTSTGSNIQNLGVENVNITGKSAGGIVSTAHGDISDCYATGQISGDIFVGGIVSGSLGNINNCYYMGEISGNSYYVGGIGGSVFNVYGSYFSGSIARRNTELSGFYAHTGGIAGYASGLISNCYSLGSIEGDAAVGGIVGRGTTAAEVSYCYSLCTIDGFVCVGGIAGVYTKIKNCAALNDMVTGEGLYPQRVEGLPQNAFDLVNNYANSAMLNFDNNTIWDEKGLNEVDGADVSLAMAKTVGFYTTSSNWDGDAWDQDVWFFENGAFPVLKAFIKTDPTFSQVGTYAYTYSQELSTKSLLGETAKGIGGVTLTGDFTFKYPDFVPTVGTTTAEIIFIPTGTDALSYNTKSFDLIISVTNADFTVNSWPTAATVTYSPAQTLSDLPLINGSASILGTFSWTDGAIIPTPNVSSYSVTFTPNDTIYIPISQNINLTVLKADPAFDQTGIYAYTYGQELNEKSLLGEKAKGVTGANLTGGFTFQNPLFFPTVGTTTAEIIFTPTGTDALHYNTKSFPLTISVAKADPAFDQTGVYAYTDGQKLNEKSLLGETAKGVTGANLTGGFTFQNPLFTPSIGTTTVEIIFTPTGTDANNYNNKSFDLIISVTETMSDKNTGSGSVNLAGWTYGDRANDPIVASVTNPDVTYIYEGRNQTIYASNSIKPINAGEYTLTAYFLETASHTACTASCSFTIAKFIVFDVVPTILVFGSAGSTLSAWVLSEGWQWKNSNIIPDKNTTQYEAIMNVSAIAGNYDFTNVAGYDENTGTITKSLSIQSLNVVFRDPASPTDMTLWICLAVGITLIFLVVLIFVIKNKKRNYR
ncbi:MAG: hypothetical protein FWG51_00030 [Firmicutes bacterium]|nr:hypothetical protein [Bacillota bacterium]